MKIATWNVNSLRVRLPHLLAWLDNEKPDIVALQETKTVERISRWRISMPPVITWCSPARRLTMVSPC